jgi:hypothetical protein
MVAGRSTVGQTAEGAATALEHYKTQFSKLPKKITLSEAKHILQSMDDDIKYISKAGEFGSRGSNALSSVRSALDEVVKKMSPAYKTQMEQVSSDTRLISDLSDKFGTPEKIYSKMNALMGSKAPLETQALSKLEQATGTGLSKQISALQEVAPIGRMSPQSTEGFLKSIMNSTSIENRKRLQLLSTLSDQDLVSMVDHTGIAEAFTKEFRAGSQHTNLWSIIGLAAIGGVTGDSLGGGMGASAGAVLGALTTKFGPAATRKILDGYSKMRGIPTVAKISHAMANVPPEIRKQLEVDLARSVSIYNGNTPVPIAKEDRKQTLLDIDRSNGLNAIEKAKAMNSLNRGGTIDSDYMRKLITDKKENDHPYIQPQVNNARKPIPSGGKLNQVSDYVNQKRDEEF